MCESYGNPLARINVGVIRFCKPRLCWNFIFLYISLFNSMLWQCFDQGLVGFRHIKHLVRNKKRSCFAWNTWFSHHKHSWKMSDVSLNVPGFVKRNAAWTGVCTTVPSSSWWETMATGLMGAGDTLAVLCPLDLSGDLWARCPHTYSYSHSSSIFCTASVSVYLPMVTPPKDPTTPPQSYLCIVYDPQNIFVLLFLEPQFFYCPPTVSPLSHFPTLALKRNVLACFGRIKACVGRIFLAVWLDYKFKLGTFLAVCYRGLFLS